MKVRQAVLMVGGKGTRLRPLTERYPKPILPILDKPCVIYLIESLVEAGIEEIIMACGYRSEHMASAIGDGSDLGIRITYSYEDTPMGTGGAIKLLENRLDDVFIAVNGDVFSDMDIGLEITEHIQSSASVTISMDTVDDPTEYGIIGVDDIGRITRFKEKPKKEEAFSNLINSGVYVVNKDVLKFIPEGQAYDMSKELFPLLLEKGYHLQGHRIHGHFRDVGRPSDLYQANVEVAERRKTGDDRLLYSGDGSVISHTDCCKTIIMAGCHVNDSKIAGSLLFPNCQIDFSTIEDSILGRGCIVGKGSLIKGVTIGDGAIIPEGAVIDSKDKADGLKRKAVFLDRDDTINDDIGHCSRPEDIKLLPGVSKALRRLNEDGFLTVLITNQSVIARGMTDEKGLERIHDKMKADLLATGGGVIDDIFFCPHHPDAGCECRKPKPLMGIRAIEKHNIDVSESYMIGDSEKDIEFGRNIKVTPIKVDEKYTFVDAVDDILSGRR